MFIIKNNMCKDSHYIAKKTSKSLEFSHMNSINGVIIKTVKS